jgi:hypothetical protein
VPGRPERVGCEGVAKLAKGSLAGLALHGRLDDLGREDLAAEPRVLVRLGAAKLVVHVQRAYPVAERAKHVPETRRVGASGNEADDLSPGRDELVPAHVLLDARPELGRLHRGILGAVSRRSGKPSLAA